MHCWFWNIDIERQNYFRDELAQGRLRQGWGYSEDLDLRKIKEKVDHKEALTPEETEAWNRCNAMLAMGNGASGREEDLIVVKNVPQRQWFSIVRVSGRYDFRIDEVGCDYGHCLPVNKPTVFNKYSAVVPAPFRAALDKARSPIIRTYAHADTVILLHETTAAEEQRTKTEPPAEIVEALRQRLIDELKKLLPQKVDHQLAELLVLNVLRHDGLDAEWTAGPMERGADVVATLYNRYGIETKMAVQVKYYQREHSDVRGIDQLELAFQEHRASALLLVTFADSIGEQLKSRIDEMRRKYTFDVLSGDDLYSALLELIADRSFKLSK